MRKKAGTGKPDVFPEETGKPVLTDIVDIESLRELLEDFYRMTGLGTSVIDIDGNVLVGVGRQPICKDFHWKNPRSLLNCKESDRSLTAGLVKGKFNVLKCKNNIWDIATPIVVEEIHLGNLFMGQFFFDEEKDDEELFVKQASEFGFDRNSYLEAYHKVPRLSRKYITQAMNLLVGFANMISCQGLNNLRNLRELREKERILRELRSSERRFASTIYSIKEGIVTVDARGRVEQMNRVAEQLTGWKEKQAAGRCIDEIIILCDESGKQSENISVSGLLKRDISQGEIKIISSKEGARIPVSISATDLINEDKEVTGKVVVFNDHSAELEKEAAAKAREERILRQRLALARLSVEESINSGDIITAKRIFTEVTYEAIQTGRISIWLFSEDETEFRCIEMFEAASGNHTEGIKYKTKDYSGYFSVLRKESRINSADVMSDKRLLELRETYVRPAGIASMMDAGIFIKGRLAGVFSCEQQDTVREWFADEESFVSTISTLFAQVLVNAERARTQGELQESMNRNQALIDSIPDLVFLFNRDGIFLNFHSPSLNSLYVGPEEFLNKKVDDVLPAYLAEITHRNLKNLFTTGEPQVYEYEMNDNGRLRYFDARMVPCGSDQAMTIVREITDQKIVQQELFLAKEKAVESDRLKSAFLANMSHEIRTPMNSIIGFASLLRENIPDEEKRDKYLDIITSNADHLLRLIDDIIDISKIETGDIEVNEEPVDLQELFEEVLKMFYDRKPWVEVRFISGNLPVILCDRVKLSQILSNLVGNAIKFTNQGYVEYSVRVDDEKIIFSVEDTGPGIAEHQQDMIFNRFAQGDNQSAGSRSGTGLGLAISKAYVERLGGKIWVRSEAGRGSTFYFSLPFVIAEKANDTNVIAEDLRDRSMKLLVAEDDILNYLFIEEIFTGMDVKITHAVNGREAVEKCSNDKFDLVLMDIKMPVMDGLEAIRKIKQLCPGIPVIAVSANAFWSDQEKAYREGCDDYITKPLRPEELKHKINRLVQFMDD